MPPRTQHDEKRCHARRCRQSKLRQPYPHMSCSKGSKGAACSSGRTVQRAGVDIHACIHAYLPYTDACIHAYVAQSLAMRQHTQHAKKRCHAQPCRARKVRQPHTHMSCSKGSKGSPASRTNICHLVAAATACKWITQLGCGMHITI